MVDTLTRIGTKAQQIADEAVGQARGATPTLKSSLQDWVTEAEASIGKNPLLAVALAGAVGFTIAAMIRAR
jgi:ElaB/YqjD/DUF883 family membrane-anchored ribosome-binding protein